MDSERRFVHLTISSRLTREMLGKKLSGRGKSFVFIEDPKDISDKGLIVIHDWRDITNRKNFRFRPAKHETDSTDADIHIIMNMTKGDEDQIPASLDRRKIRGLFYIEDSLATFTKGLEKILAGEIWVPRTVLVNWMGSQVADNASSANTNVLSTRQESILRFVALGMSNIDIAKKLDISSNTVKAHLYAIFKLINVSNRIQAAHWAAKNLPEDDSNPED
jgi:DNA-binding NarL/FixJ family response regulator